jgi:type VI secretion system protein
MALKLTIISEQRAQLAGRASIVLGVGGGSLGRAHDNDWVLPDPQRFLSAHHARIQYRSGSYYLLDTSTNGVFVNDGKAALGRRGSYPLRDGDRLRFGDYRVAVKLDPEPTEAPEASAIFPLNPEPRPGDPPAAGGDIGADLNVRDLLRPDPSPSLVGPVDAFGQPTLTDDTGLLAFDQSDQRETPARMVIPSAARRELRATERAATETAAGIEALCRGAGIDARQLPPDAQTRLLHLAGVLLREALVGLKGLAVAQREIREQTHVQVGRDDPQHIGLTGLPVEDLLLLLLLGHERHELDAVQWLRDMLGSTHRHDLAMMHALRAALGEFIARLDPKALAQSTGGQPPTVIDRDSSGLTARFRSITEMTAGRLPHLFGEAFARAFVAEFKPNGADQARS